MPCRVGSFPADFRGPEVFMVFFDRDSIQIDRQAAIILDAVVKAWRALPQPQCPIEISAHADTSGSSDYNLALSRRRAQAVAAYLRGHGVNSEIRPAGFGETRLLVETSDEVREPQNRRAEISIVPNP